MILNSRNRLRNNFRAKGNLSFGLEMFENIFDTTELTPLVSTGTQNLWGSVPLFGNAERTTLDDD